MFIDRFGNNVERVVEEEPIVEQTVYDPRRPVRPGFEKPEYVQEGLFDALANKPSSDYIETLKKRYGNIPNDVFEFMKDKRTFEYNNNKFKEIQIYPETPATIDANTRTQCEVGGRFHDAMPFAQAYVGELDDDSETYKRISHLLDDDSCWVCYNISTGEIELRSNIDKSVMMLDKDFNQFMKHCSEDDSYNEYAVKDIDEMSDYIQEGLFDIFKKDPPFESFEEMEEYTGSKIDPSFKKFNQSHNKGDIINYPVSKIDDDYCRNMIEEYYGDTVPFKMFGQHYILKNEGRYRDIIDTNDYCIAFAEIGPDPDGNLDPLCLWIATEKTKTWNAGTILLSEVINPDYPDDGNVFTKSFKEFSKNVTSGKSIKEYSEMDIDEMSDYIQEHVITEANEEAKKARKNAQEFMRREYGTAHPTSMTSKQRNRMKRWLKDNDYDPKTGTIATDMKYGDGETIRVNLGTNSAVGKNLGHDSNMPFYAISTPGYPKEKYTPAEQRAFVGGRELINMPKEYMKRHPSVSTGLSKHEEGHIADFYGKIDDVDDRRAESNEHLIQSMKKGVDYSPTHTNVDEAIADLYSVRHNKYKDKLRFLNALLSDDIHMQKHFKTRWEKLCKNVYKKRSDDQPPIIDASSVETMRDSIKALIKNAKISIKQFKQGLKNPSIYPSGKKLLERTIDCMTKTCNDFEKILKKWFFSKLLFKKVKYDDAKFEVDRIVWEDAKRAIDETIRQSDGDIEIRREFLKMYINEFAIEYDMSTIDVIQEMYQTAFEDYVFQEEGDPSLSEEEYQVFVEAKINAAERNELDDDDFGLVYEDEDGKKIRKYPLTDKQHVLQAVRFFGDCPDEYKPLLAHNILKRAKKFDMDTSNWDKIHEWNEKYSDEDDEK